MEVLWPRSKNVLALNFPRCVNVSMNDVSMCRPYDELVTRPGCTPPLTQYQVGLSPSFWAPAKDKCLLIIEWCIKHNTCHCSLHHRNVSLLFILLEGWEEEDSSPEKAYTPCVCSRQSWQFNLKFLLLQAMINFLFTHVHINNIFLLKVSILHLVLWIGWYVYPVQVLKLLHPNQCDNLKLYILFIWIMCVLILLYKVSPFVLSRLSSYCTSWNVEVLV